MQVFVFPTCIKATCCFLSSRMALLNNFLLQWLELQRWNLSPQTTVQNCEKARTVWSPSIRWNTAIETSPSFFCPLVALHSSKCLAPHMCPAPQPQVSLMKNVVLSVQLVSDCCSRNTKGQTGTSSWFSPGEQRSTLFPKIFLADKKVLYKGTMQGSTVNQYRNLAQKAFFKQMRNIMKYRRQTVHPNAPRNRDVLPFVKSGSKPSHSLLLKLLMFWLN